MVSAPQGGNDYGFGNLSAPNPSNTEHSALRFLAISVAHYLLDHAGVRQLPISVRQIVQNPPIELAQDLSLTESELYGKAHWVRLLDGQGVVFVNQRMSIPICQTRYAIAKAIFVGIWSSRGAKSSGVHRRDSPTIRRNAAVFARELLLPRHLLPENLNELSATELADLCAVPVDVAEARLQELRPARRQTKRTSPVAPAITAPIRPA